MSLIAIFFKVAQKRRKRKKEILLSFLYSNHFFTFFFKINYPGSKNLVEMVFPDSQGQMETHQEFCDSTVSRCSKTNMESAS